MLKPGGILIIDHRNYDYILKHGKSPNKNIYYNSSIYKVVTKTIYEDGKAKQIILDYRKKGEEDGNFLLHVQPYKLSEFSSLLKVSGEKDCFRIKARIRCLFFREFLEPNSNQQPTRSLVTSRS